MPPTFQHILTATDFSEASRAAVELARAMAGECGAELTVVHVCEVPGYSETGPIPYDVAIPVVTRAHAELAPLLAHLRQACAGARAIVRIGAPAEEILAAARDLRADLVVLGTHGRRGFAHAMTGSVAEKVVRTSPVPVLTVRTRQTK